MTEKEIRSDERVLRQVIENLRDVFWVLSPDLETFVYLSSAYQEIWGRPAESAIGKCSLAGWDALPDDRAKVREAMDRARHSHALDTTFRIAPAGGSVRWIENRGVAVYGEGEPDDIGYLHRPVVAFVGAARDITEQRKAQDALLRSEARLLQAQRMAQSGTWEWEIASGELWWSEEVHRIFGMGPLAGNVSYPTFIERVHPRDRAMVEAAVAHTLRTLEPYAVEHRIVRPDGEVRHVDERGGLLFENGRAVHMIGSVRDVTDQRRAEARQKMLAQAVEQTSDHVLITDRHGAIEFANPSFEKASGYSLGELLARTPSVLKSGRHHLAFYSGLWSTVTSGGVFRADFENRRKDGSVYIEEKTITPIRSEADEITHFVSVGRDITTRRAAEIEQAGLVERVRQSAAEWTATFDAVEMPMAVVDRKGLVMRLNLAMAAAADRPLRQMIGRPLPTEGEPWAAIQKAAAAAGRSLTSAHLEARDEGGGRTWQVTASPVHQERRGVSPVFVIVARDVSGLVQLQEKLRRTETMSALGELLAGVAHEVRNPLFGIGATLDAFEDDFSHVGESAAYLRLIRGEVERLTNLMRDLLEFGKRSAAILEPGPIEPVLRRAVRACLPMAASRVAIHLHVADGLPAVEMDPPRIAQVLQNLIENAVQHSPEGEGVDVTCEAADGWLRCSVGDSGPGVSEKDLTRVFEPFYSRRRGGTGLGLSIVQRIVEEHGGQVHLANRPGGGAIATVELPVTKAGSPADLDGPPPPRGPKGRSRKGARRS